MLHLVVSGLRAVMRVVLEVSMMRVMVGDAGLLAHVARMLEVFLVVLYVVAW